MAIDTARRRKSAVYGSLPFAARLPTPDGIVETEDRYILGYHYSGLTASAPSFVSPIQAFLVVQDSGTHNIDTGSHFSGAVSYSISPSVETGWSFDTATGVLTIDTDATGNFGPYTVTGTNTIGSVASNAFRVTVATTPKGIAINVIAIMVGSRHRNSRRYQ